MEGRPYGLGKRLFYGITWAFWTIVALAGGILLVTSGDMVGLLIILVGLGFGYYDYTIWTYRARRLWFIY
ncbi:MAG: hypothetical protein J2P25_20655 [Nocardiopsaceae bacterium]|nr:hypothetical protein [Nocardiopsaceae bacterium]